MTAVRLGCVRYLNVVPLVDGLETSRDVEIRSAVPSRIAPMLLSGETDLGLVSVVDLLRSGGELTALRVGMIGCDGPTLTVRLYSRVPPEGVTRLHADTDSRTSVELARLVLRELHGAQAEVVDFHAREAMGAGEPAADTPDEAWPESVLLIGDKVVVNSPPAIRYPYQIDLGQAWRELTGLPFIYAIWACRTEDVASGASAERVRAIRSAAVVLDRQRRRNLARLDDLISRRARAAGWPMDLARTYLGTLLRYEVSDESLRGMASFAARLAAAGVLEQGVGERVRVLGIEDLEAGAARAGAVG